MSQVLITCPETKRPVYTGLNYEWPSFDAADLPRQTLKCPHCGKIHSWSKAEAFLRADGGG
jgi:hypothetical protein